ncbi:MAG: carbohydrate-binding family 9-like protein [Verrucomicrobia bacterium]|nr:carbohydrate-binding family 9-like protein [Verrucomicrobiota bacterium]
MTLLAVFDCVRPRRHVAARSLLLGALVPAGRGFRHARILIVAVLWLAAGLGYGGDWVFPCPTNEIARYTAHRVTEPIRIDGRLDEPAWRAAPVSPRFVDIITGEPARFDTRAMVLWDATNLYVAYRVEEPNVRATYTKPNDPIYYDNDIELFVAGPDAYYEFELNAFNTPVRSLLHLGRSLRARRVCPGRGVRAVEAPALQRRGFHHASARRAARPVYLDLPRPKDGRAHRRHDQ